MKIYNITKGQLITAWIFGVIFIFAALSNVMGYDSEVWAEIGVLIVPAVLIFYTLGWKQHNKKDSLGSSTEISKFKINKKIILIPVILILLLIGASVAAYNQFRDGGKVPGLSDIRNNDIEEYVGHFNRYKKHFENAQQCEYDFIERNKSTSISKCEAKYNDAYATYQNCRKDMHWLDHYDCINWPGGNYEAFDCSEEAIIADLKNQETSCFNTVNTEYMHIISFEEKLLNDYLNQLPRSQSVVSILEMENLYSLMPGEVFNEKTKERFNKYIEHKGYTIQ